MATKTPHSVALAAVYTAMAVAACSYALAASAKTPDGLFLLQLTPAGQFLPSDGRPLDSPAWNIDAASAQAVIARFKALKQPPVIDYEHQTLNKEKNGQPAPAAGWIRDMLWLDGQGLYAAVELTTRAQGYIELGEYKFFSPVFEYSKDSGTVMAVHMGALTNTPAIHGMDPLTLRAAATAAFIPPQPTQEQPVNPLLKALLVALCLPDTTTETAACAALAAVGPIPALQEQATAARQALALPADASGDAVLAACTSLRTAATPDPAKFVPIAVVDDMRTSLAALTARQAQADIDAAVAPALADGRLLPAQESWARDLGRSNMAALTAYLASAQPIGALTGTQTSGRPPVDTTPAGQLTPEQLAVCSAMGLSTAQFATGQANA